MKAVQEAAVKVSTRSWGTLLSRTGTIRGLAGFLARTILRRRQGVLQAGEHLGAGFSDRRRVTHVLNRTFRVPLREMRASRVN